MRIYLDQIGCRLNYSEMETLAQRLRAAGHRTVNAPEQAQVIVFNTCAVTAEADSKSRQRARQLHQANPQARLALTGCWATLKPTQAAELPGVALVADNSRKELLSALLEPWSAELDDPADLTRMQPDGNPFHLSAEGAGFAHERRRRTRAFVKVQDGCNNRCTFCVVAIARGHSRSRPIAEVTAEVESLAKSGVKEVVLTGVHLGSYGRDLAGAERTDLKQLATAILADTDIARLRLSSLEPWELAEGFFDLWQQWPGRLCPHLHLPLQSGTDKQLRRMARRCTTTSFRQLAQEARSAIPDLIVTTDLIVGFPGETERDFEESMAFVAEMRFIHAHIFPFSLREGAAAARFGDQVVGKVKRERTQRMRAVVEHTGRAERLAFLGETRPVLWEGGQQELLDSEEQLWTGFTDNYLRVMATAPARVNLHGAVTPVHLGELHGDTFFGKII
jgi:threonylcarbamoyladenosine tRNA methylthiotransferase MtaB